MILPYVTWKTHVGFVISPGWASSITIRCSGKELAPFRWIWRTGEMEPIRWGKLTFTYYTCLLICGVDVHYDSQECSFSRQNLAFVKSIEEALENLVQTTVKMSASPRSHSFPPMNSNHRRLVHEIAVFYNCSSRSYDQEPKRSTVVTATKLVSYICTVVAIYFTL